MSDYLSASEHERLAFLMEEMAEALHMAGKTLRHGYESTHSDYGNLPNSMLLAKELGDVEAAIELLVRNHDIARMNVDAAKEKKLAKVRRGTHFHHKHDTGATDGASA